MAGKPLFTVYDLRSLSQDDIDEIRIALHERLITLRSIVSGHEEDSIELARRRGRVEALYRRVSFLRHDPSCMTRGNAARAAHKSAINSAAIGMRNGKAQPQVQEPEQADADED